MQIHHTTRIDGADQLIFAVDALSERDDPTVVSLLDFRTVVWQIVGSLVHHEQQVRVWVSAQRMASISGTEYFTDPLCADVPDSRCIEARAFDIATLDGRAEPNLGFWSAVKCDERLMQRMEYDTDFAQHVRAGALRCQEILADLSDEERRGRQG